MRFGSDGASSCDGGETKVDFLLDSPSHYFKSSFARSVLHDSQGPRSLDAAVGARRKLAVAAAATESADDDQVVLQRPSGRPRSHTEVARIWKLKQSTSSPGSPKPQSPAPPPAVQSRDADHAAASTASVADRPPPSLPLRLPPPTPPQPADHAETTRLQKECQGLQEENRRLHGVLDAARDSSLMLDIARLQSQVDTLAWQLKQSEASRHMYRRVMEQVVLFLERTHKSLNNIQPGVPPSGIKSLSNGNTLSCRVPRSRSVHTVDVSPSRVSPRSDSVLHFPRAKSIAQIEETQNYSTFRDFTWRRPRKTTIDPDCVPPEKLSEESFRLLRLVQSLLNVQEPDLAQRMSIVSDSASLVSSGLDHLQDTSYTNSISQRSSTTSSGLDITDDKGSVLELPHSYNKKSSKLLDSPPMLSISRSSPAPSACSRIHSSPDTISIHSVHSTTSKNLEFKNTALTSGLESGFAGHPLKGNYNSPSLEKELDSGNGYSTNRCSPKQQLSEDESGFSSMNSFQEVGVPITTPPPPLPSSPLPGGSFQEVGLPLIDNLPPNNSCPSRSHRRWSSTPVAAQTHFPPHNRSFCLPGESLRVLWV